MSEEEKSTPKSFTKVLIPCSVLEKGPIGINGKEITWLIHENKEAILKVENEKVIILFS